MRQALCWIAKKNERVEWINSKREGTIKLQARRIYTVRVYGNYDTTTRPKLASANRRVTLIQK